MADFSDFEVDLDTPQPNGRKGESPRAAFSKHNDLLAELAKRVEAVSATAPSPAWPFMTWADTANMLLKRRNAANTAWVVEGALFVRSVRATGDSMSGPLSIATDGQTDQTTAGLQSRTASSSSGDAIIAVVVAGAGAAILRLPRADPQNLVVESSPGNLINVSARIGTSPSHLVRFSQILGLGQTWQDMTGSRVAGTTYTNTTGKPIAVSIYWSSRAASQGGICVEGGARDIASNFVANGFGTNRCIVPPGATYSFQNASGVASLSWRELR